MDLNDELRNFETEDIFDKDEKLRIQKIIYPESIKYSKKLFNSIPPPNPELRYLNKPTTFA
jgi:hypothetical protein